MLTRNCLHYISYLGYLVLLTIMKIQYLPEQALMITVFIAQVLKWEKVTNMETQSIRMHFIK